MLEEPGATDDPRRLDTPDNRVASHGVKRGAGDTAEDGGGHLENSTSRPDVNAIVVEHAHAILTTDVELSDNFFDVGGDSLSGMHLVGRVGRSLDAPVRMTLLFKYPVLRDFAQQVEMLQRSDEAGNSDLR